MPFFYYVRLSHRSTGLLALAMLLQYAGQDARAASDAVASTVTAGASDMDDVVVTARRRSESLKDVPVAVTALSAADIDQKSLTTDADLQRSVPGLTIRQTFNANQIAYSIRGQTIDAFSGSRPAVISYLNDVQVPQGASSAYYDLESIQVLKGPQGTLFGRNATGGAVLLSTAKPKDDLDGFVTIGAGNYGLHEEEAAIDVPLVAEKLLLRVAGQNKDRDGYVHNLFDGKYLGSIDNNSARFTLVAMPTDDLKITTVGQVSDNNGTSAGGEVYSGYGCGSKNGAFSLVSTAACLYSPTLDSVIGVPGAWNAFLAAHPNVPAGGILQQIAIQRSLGPWTTSLDEPEHYDVRARNFSNIIAYQIGPDISIKNILGYGSQNTHMHTDLDGSPFPIEHNYNATTGEDGIIFDTEEMSEEFQVLGKTLDENLDYIFGLYASKQTDNNHQNFEAANLLPIIPPANGSNIYRLRNESEGVFAQGTYDASDLTGISKLSFTAGARMTWDRNEIDQLYGADMYTTFGTDHEEASAHKPSWQFGIEYKPDTNWMFYANQRGSWRSGGFNGAAPAIDVYASQGGNRFRPETTTDVELGAKYSGRVFSRPARANLAVYNQLINNVQRTAYVDIAGALSAVTASVPKAKVTGLELDGDVAPFDWLRVGGSLSYTDARYKNNVVDLFGQTFIYDSYADTPRLSGDVFTEFYIPVNDEWGTMSVRADVYLQSKQYLSNNYFSTDPGTVFSSYALVNLHANWNDIFQSRYSLSFYMTNIGDHRYYVGGFPEGTVLGINTAVPGMPSMFGFTATARF